MQRCKTPSSNSNGTPLASINTTSYVANSVTTGAFGRSWNVLTIHRISGVTTVKCYDIFGLETIATTLANDLNALTPDYIVAISTFDEPQTAGGINPLPAGLITAVKRCGGSSDFGSSNGTPVGIINYRGAYLLVGVPGIGTGNGIQRYLGVATGTLGKDGDPLAAIDVRFSITNGIYTYI